MTGIQRTPHLEFKSNIIVTTENDKVLSTLTVESNCKNKYSENIIGIQEDTLFSESSEPLAGSPSGVVSAMAWVQSLARRPYARRGCSQKNF